MKEDYRAVEQLTLRYTDFCRARISRLLVKPENTLSAIESLMACFINGGFVAEIDIYRSQLIAIFKDGRKRCKPLRTVLEDMERYRAELLETLDILVPDKYGQPIYDSSVFVRNDSEKIRTVVHYFAHRQLLAYLIRTKAVFESRAIRKGIDDSAHNPEFRALNPGGGYFDGAVPTKVAAGLSST